MDEGRTDSLVADCDYFERSGPMVFDEQGTYVESVPWEALTGQIELTTKDEWRVRDRPWRLPHSYRLQAVKQA